MGATQQPDTVQFRQPRTKELDEFLALSLRSYGMDGSADQVAHERLSNGIDRSYGARDSDRWVAGSGAFDFEVTLPGGAIVPAAGVTMIGVAPTHRRQGILTEMVRWLHADAARRGEPIALLTASESSIYRRFGYGVATEASRLRISASSVVFDPPVEVAGSFMMFDPHDDTSAVEAVFDRVRRTSPGWLSLTEGMWAQIRADPAFDRHGRSVLQGVVHQDENGVPDGFACWRVAQHERAGWVADNTLHIEYLVADSPDVEAALWQFLADVDLVTTIAWNRGPVEPTIRWRLVEPRQLHFARRHDLIWARILDIEHILSVRGYPAAGTVTLHVDDPFQPELGGRFRLVSDGPGRPASCTRVDAEPDLVMDVSALSSIAMGNVAPSALAGAGRIQARSAELFTLADTLFVSHPASWCPIEF